MTIVVQVILNRRNRMIKEGQKKAAKAKPTTRRITALRSLPKELATEPPILKQGSTRKRLLADDLEFVDKQFAEMCFHKYDTNEDKELDYGEMKALLTRLNEGVAPTEEEIIDIVEKADANKSGRIDTFEELQEAIAQWYALVGEKHTLEQTNSCACALQ